jgi:hypothetical protein
VDLDEEKLEALRAWGEALRQADSEEYAAVGRALVMLIEEIDRLHIALWHTRLELSRAATTPATASDQTEATVTVTLHDRVQRVLRRGPDSTPARPAAAGGSEPEAGSDAPAAAEGDGATSALSWIEALRRRK